VTTANEPCLTHAYVARKPCCKSVVFIGVDDASADLGREIAKLIRDGRTIERVTIEEARKLGSELLYRCTCEPSAAEKKVIARRVREKKKLVSGFVTRRSK
jgi:hypothetical protein